MFKRIAMVVATVMAASPPAWGFSSGSDQTREGLSKACSVETMLDAGPTKRAWVMISVTKAISQPGAVLSNVSGGAYWDGDAGSSTAQSSITEKFLGSCGVPFVPGSLVQKGADALSFGQQTYMGFGYRSTSGGWVEFIIGSGTLEPTNSVPTANAGPDQSTVASAATVSLDGSGSSDPDAGDTLTYAWTQTDSSGTTVTLSSTTAAQPTFTAPTLGANHAAVTLVFSLVVTDDKTNASTADMVSITVNPPDPTPASEFAENEAEIRQAIVDDEQRSLSSILSANRPMTNEARRRLIDARRSQDGESAGFVSRNDVPFGVNGTFTLSETRLSTRGTFFEQRSTAEGTARRLIFGDFDVQHDGNTDSTTATLTGRMAWEQMYGDKTMLGYFIGGELAHSNIKGSFEGEQDRLGLAFGGYAVHQLDEQMFLDGFITLGAGRNDLEMANDVLALTSDYTTRTATVGAALSGVYEYDQYEFRPELAFSYGKTWIGDVGFTGVAYGLTDNTLSLDAGNVSITNLTLRPEVVWALDADTVADSRTQLTYAPRLICERVQSTTTTQDCGAGGEIGLTSTSRDGMSNAEFRVIVDKVDDSTRSSLMLNFERQF